MSRTIYLRNVPDTVYRLLKLRAAAANMSVSDYLLSETREMAEKPTWEEPRERLNEREPFTGPLETEAAVRALRGD